MKTTVIRRAVYTVIEIGRGHYEVLKDTRRDFQNASTTDKRVWDTETKEGRRAIAGMFRKEGV